MLNEITKFLFFFHDLKNYDYHLIMQKLSKFNLKINDMPNGLGKYMSISNRLGFIDGFQFLSSLFYSFLIGKKISDKEYVRVLKFWNKFKMKTIKH